MGIVAKWKINDEEVLSKKWKKWIKFSFSVGNEDPQMTRYGDYPDFGQVKKILVIKLRHLGDVLLTGPVFRTLTRAFPEAKIDVYVYEEAFPMLEGHFAVDKLIGYERAWKKLWFFARLSKEASILWQIRSAGYDLAVNLTEGDRGLLAVKASGARVRVGMPPKGKWKRKCLTHVAKECPSIRHAVEKNLDVLRRIGIFPSQEDRELDFYVPKESLERAYTLVGLKPFVLIHPTSRWRFKCWPISKMRGLIEKLADFGFQVVLSAGTDLQEKQMADQIAKDLPVLNLAGKISLKELGALIQISKALVCVDSLPFHLANALKKPVVALFGPTSDQTWGPWRNPSATVAASSFSCRPCYLDGCGGSKKSDCLESLSVEVVWSALERQLQNSLAR